MNEEQVPQEQDKSSSQAGLASFDQAPKAEDAAAMMQAAAEQPAVQTAPESAQASDNPNIIDKVPGFSSEAKVLELPVPAESTVADSEQTDGDSDADVIPLQKPVIDRVPTVEELKAKEQ